MGIKPVKVLVTNRKARRDYSILNTTESGIVLKGTEVKSLRQGKGSLLGSYAAVENGEVWIHGLHITPYEHSGVLAPSPKRSRKLLLHKREIKRLIGVTAVKGHTLIPLRLYLRGRVVKIELGVGKGKKMYDKRQTIKKRDAEREVSQALKGARRRC
ncbi:MAG: SsrA-binding protein SmpB [Candidatus Euphemobacter frigidus]|nr:SsrA-binding protein SmpB [Candidatus Euphemobacter frigidus]MDP8276569.1 SsrA-binding protein SmpB [Candidatus Euphemobacter frigidus]